MVRQILEEKPELLDADLTQGKFGIFSDYTPTSFKAIYSDKQDSLGYRGLHWAARNGNLEMTRYLCSKGANVNVKNAINNTPLQVAIFYQHFKIADHLLEHQADGSGLYGVSLELNHYLIYKLSAQMQPTMKLELAVATNSSPHLHSEGTTVPNIMRNQEDSSAPLNIQLTQSPTDRLLALLRKKIETTREGFDHTEKSSAEEQLKK